MTSDSNSAVRKLEIKCWYPSWLLVAGILSVHPTLLRKIMIVFNVKRNTLHVSLSNIKHSNLFEVLLNDHKMSKESPIFLCYTPYLWWSVWFKICFSQGHKSKVICFYNTNSHIEKLSNTLFLITFNQNCKYWTSSTK